MQWISWGERHHFWGCISRISRLQTKPETSFHGYVESCLYYFQRHWRLGNHTQVEPGQQICQRQFGFHQREPLAWIEKQILVSSTRNSNFGLFCEKNAVILLYLNKFPSVKSLNSPETGHVLFTDINIHIIEINWYYFILIQVKIFLKRDISCVGLETSI